MGKRWSDWRLGSSALPGGDARAGTSGLLAAGPASCATGNDRAHSVRRGERGADDRGDELRGRRVRA